MPAGARRPAPQRRGLGLFVALGLTLLVTLFGVLASAERAATAPAIPGVSFVPELGLPATGVVAIGASPAEAPGEAWAYGYLGPVPPAGNPAQVERYALLEHNDLDGWTTVPLPGAPLRARDGFPGRLGALGGRATLAGGVVLLTDGGIVVRDPGAAPRFAPTPAGDALLGEAESLPPQAPPAGAPTPYAAVDEDGGGTGLLIAPYGNGEGEGPTALDPGVLHYDGGDWSREPLATDEYNRVETLAIDCGPEADRPWRFSPLNCWLLAKTWSEGSARLALFHRQLAADEAGAYEWAALEVRGGLLGSQAGGEPDSLALSPLGALAQTLTATARGVWVDFRATRGGEVSSATELVVPDGGGAKVEGSWCHPTGPDCGVELGAPLPAAYRSFAWAGGSTGDPGERVITGLPERTMLRLAGGSFTLVRGVGGSPGIAPGGAALTAPDDGFLADGADPHAGRDGAGQSQVFAMNTAPPGEQLASEPVPFRHPLLGLAIEPGTEAGNPDSEAIAVGLEGELARFVPGQGWRQYPMQRMEGRGAVGLRDVAWPSPDVAYAVGDFAAIREWRRSSDRWVPDISETGPAAAHFESVAFSPVDPERGFAVGQMQIFRHDERGWHVSGIPLEALNDGPVAVNSVTFAGNEALASFRSAGAIEGGLMRNRGANWEVDHEFGALLHSLPASAEIAPTEVAGLPDGGAIVAGPGWVVKRESADAPWGFASQPLPEAHTVTALAAHRDPAGTLRATVSIAPGPYRPPEPSDSFGPPPNPPAGSGYPLRETATGWTDIEHRAFPAKDGSADMPARPEPVFDLAVAADGESGLAVGGQSGNFTGGEQPVHAPAGPPPEPHFETAAALRFPADLAHDPNRSEPIRVSPANTAIAVGGQAACATACANQAAVGIGPDAWLTQALASVAEIGDDQPAHLRAFLYTGGRLSTETSDGYGGELDRLAELFAQAGSPPLLTAASPDLMWGGAQLFSSTFAAFGPAGGSSYYAFRSEAAGHVPVLFIVLDYSAGALGATQEAWLEDELALARKETIASVVVGNASLSPPLADSPPAGGVEVLQASDAEKVIPLIVSGGASAYVYDYPGANVIDVLRAGDQGIPAIGAGALGYTPTVGSATDSLAAGAYLLAELLATTGPGGESKGVAVRAIPAIESLTLHSAGGSVIEAGRSEQFEALGRRAAGGVLVEEVEGKPVFGGPEPYVTMPFASADLRCAGPNCRREVPLEFSFSTSDPQVGTFISRDAEEAAGAEAEPVLDQRSGLFCARAPGETTVTVTAGGLSYSQPITVTPGDGEDHCLERLPEPPSEAPVAHSEGPETTPERPPPTPESPAAAQPQAPASQPQPNGIQAEPPPVSPTPQPAALGQPALPAASPYPPPGVQPVPPAGLSPASNPVTQPVSQGTSQGSFQPVAQAVNAPGVALSEGEAEEAALQRVHHAVAVDASLVSASHTPWTESLLIPALALLLGIGIGLGAIDARARRNSYEEASIGR